MSLAAELSNPLVTEQTRFLWRWAGILSAALYLILACLLGLNTLGLQYDEALNQHGAVHLLNSTEAPSFVYHKGSWINVAGRHWPLMIIPYAGAIKHYVLVVPFAILGTDAIVGRLVSALLGAVGILGMWKFLRGEIGSKPAAIVAAVLASNPAYLIHTIYDNGTVVVWMTIVGLLALAARRFIAHRSASTAFVLGLVMGLGVWNRANFVWLLISVLLAAALIYRKQMILPVKQLATLGFGGLIGGAPFLLYQFLSGWDIFAFMQSRASQESVASILEKRLPVFFETFLITSENRDMWGGGVMPVWQTLFLAILVVSSALVCLLMKERADCGLRRFRRATTLSLIFFSLFMLTSRLNVAPHHFVTLVPIAAVVVVMALQLLISRWPTTWIVASLVVVIYFGSAAYWDRFAARAFRATGGVGSWSDAVFSVNDYLQTNLSGREVNILDWGLKNNLFVLSNGELKAPEIFWGATPLGTSAGIPWRNVISRGGVFLTNSPGNVHFPAARNGFLSALATAGYASHRVEFRHKTGAPYAEIIEVFPGIPSKDTRSTIGVISASPGTIVVCDDSRLGVTTLTWSSRQGTQIEIRVGAPDGALFAKPYQDGSSQTGKWVADRTVFVMQDVTGGKPLTAEHTIATVVVRVTSDGCK